MYRQLSIGRCDDGSHVGENALGRQLRNNDLSERPVTVVRELRMRMIDHKRRCVVHVEHHIAHHTGNLERRPSAGGNALTDNRVERHSRKGSRLLKFLSHHQSPASRITPSERCRSLEPSTTEKRRQ